MLDQRCQRDCSQPPCGDMFKRLKTRTDSAVDTPFTDSPESVFDILFSFDRCNRNRAFLPYVFETTSLRRVPGMKHLDTSGISYSNYHTTRYSVHEYMISGMILHYVLVFHILPYGKPTHFKWVAHHFARPRLWRASKQGQRWCERSLNLFWSPPKMTFP